MSKKILVPLAEGAEEIEFISIVDVLRRAGAKVIIAALDDKLLVKGAHGIEIKADCTLHSVSVKELDGIALAGGYQGMINLKNSNQILDFIKTLNCDKKLVAAICASPIVLNEAGVLNGDFTCYPGCENGLNANFISSPTVVNANIITGAGPALAIHFALELVKYLYGQEAYSKLYQELLMPLTKQ